GKLYQTLLISVIGVVTTGIVLLVFFKIPVLKVAALVILGCLGSIPMTAVNLLVDILNPKLEWTNPQEAMKRNINGLFGMLASMIIILIFTALVIVMVVLKLPEWGIYLILGLAMTGMAVPAVAVLLNTAERKYVKLEG